MLHLVKVFQCKDFCNGEFALNRRTSVPTCRCHRQKKVIVQRQESRQCFGQSAVILIILMLVNPRKRLPWMTRFCWFEYIFKSPCPACAAWCGSLTSSGSCYNFWWNFLEPWIIRCLVATHASSTVFYLPIKS